MEDEKQGHDQKRRYSDSPAYIRKVGGMSIVSIAAAICAIAVIGNMFWQSKDKAVEDKSAMECKIATVQNDMTEIKTSLRYIAESVKEIKDKVK